MESKMESKNIIIRKTVFEDCELFAKWEIMPQVADYFSMNSDRRYEDVVREFVRRELDKTKLQFTVCDKNEMPIGRIYISKVDRDNDALDITRIYIAENEYRRKGYGEDALRMILEYCFLNLHTERVTLSYFEGNNVASALSEKLGFKHEGLARNGCKKNGKYYDLHLCSILRAEYYVKIRDR